MRSSTYVYFSKRPRLVLLDVYAIESVLKPYLVEEQPRHPTPLQLKEMHFLTAHVEQAETDLLASRIAFGLGVARLEEGPELVDARIKQCYERGFPFGWKAFLRILDFAKSLPEVPAAAYSPANLHQQTIVELRHLAQPFVRQRPTSTESVRLWTQDDWDQYFAAYPNEEFRIPVLTAARALVNAKPEAFNDVALRLFGRLLPPEQPSAILKGSTWEEDLAAAKQNPEWWQK